jgi:DNA-damage-inducible protein J
MSQSTLSVRLNSEDKEKFEAFCDQVGMNPSVAVNMFVKAVIREQKLPFEIKTYSAANTKLDKSAKQRKGK